MAHGDHWEAIFGDTETIVDEVIPQILRLGRPSDIFPFEFENNQGQLQKEEAASLTYLETPLRLMALVVTNSTGESLKREMWTAYPIASDGRVHRIRVDEIKICEYGFEGIVHGKVKGGASISFFDPEFFKNRHIYESGKAYDFSVAGIAYVLKPAKQQSLTIDEGPILEMERERLLEEDPNADPNSIIPVELSLAEMRCLLPRELADDSEFRTVIDEAGYFEVEGHGVFRLRATMMIPDDHHFDINLYASEAVLEGYRPKPGDSIEGVLWLQGRLASDLTFESTSDFD